MKETKRKNLLIRLQIIEYLLVNKVLELSKRDYLRCAGIWLKEKREVEKELART